MNGNLIPIIVYKYVRKSISCMCWVSSTFFTLWPFWWICEINSPKFGFIMKNPGCYIYYVCVCNFYLTLGSNPYHFSWKVRVLPLGHRGHKNMTWSSTEDSRLLRAPLHPLHQGFLTFWWFQTPMDAPTLSHTPFTWVNFTAKIMTITSPISWQQYNFHRCQ